MKKLMFSLIVATVTFVSENVNAQEADFLPQNRTEISVTDLPNHVRTVLDSKEFDGWKLVAVYRSDDYATNGPKARYLIRMQYEVEFKDVYLDGAGLAYDPD